MKPIPLVHVAGLEMTFNGNPVLRNIEIGLFPGEVHAIVGENGAGKSTLAKIIAGVHRPIAGSILRNGVPCQFRNPREALAAGIALVHQEPLTFPELSVAENIFVGNLPRSRFGTVDWKALNERAATVMARVGLDLAPSATVGTLSVAKQQMVELAAALAHDARVILLDETTASLTPKEVAELFVIVGKLRSEGCALAFVSHKLNEVFEIADRITVLRDGAKVAEVLPAQSSAREIVKLMVGRDIEYGEGTARPVENVPILSVRDLCAVNGSPGVNFDISPGEIVGIAGLVGAGRTEIAETLFGVHPPVSGTILLDGKPVRFRKPADALSAGIALVPEDRQHHGLLLPSSIAENAVLPILKRLSRFWTIPQKENGIGESWIRDLAIACRGPLQPVRELSGGNQQKVVLAKAQLCTPRLLIVDEPTRGVDVGAKSEVHRLLRKLANEGMAIIAVSSDLTEVLQISDRLLVMRNHAIVAEFSGVEATEEKVMLAATGQGS